MTKITDLYEESTISLILEHSPSILIICDKAGKISFVSNPIQGRPSPEKLVGSNIYDYIEPEYHNIHRNLIYQSFEKNKGGLFQTQAAGPNNTVSWYESKIEPLSKEGNVFAVAIYLQDITDRKNFHDELVEKTKDLQEMNKYMVNREVKMSELKERIKVLEDQVSQLKEILSKQNKSPKA